MDELKQRNFFATIRLNTLNNLQSYLFNERRPYEQKSKLTQRLSYRHTHRCHRNGIGKLRFLSVKFGEEITACNFVFLFRNRFFLRELLKMINSRLFLQLTGLRRQLRQPRIHASDIYISIYFQIKDIFLLLKLNKTFKQEFIQYY